MAGHCLQLAPTSHPPAPEYAPCVPLQAADELPIECATSLILSLQKCAAAAGGLAPQEGSPCCNAMAAAVKGPCAGHNVAKAMEGEGDPESLQVQAQM